jgi:predicted GNAT family N-acyltransferase
MEYKLFEKLDDANHAKMIREKVFMEEQGFQDEFDDIDKISLHLEIYKDNKAIGCARMYSVKEHEYIFGRIAILKEYRGKGYGLKILQILEEEAKKRKALKVQLSAQVRASVFYEKAGYKKVGEEYFDEYCPHIKMIKTLNEK